jgi:kumamolisin
VKLCLRVASLLLLASISRLEAATPAQVALNNSVREVEIAPQTGPLDPHTPFITRKTLKASESGATLEFEVALKMRNFAELQARVGRGERISPGEVDSKYNPTAADYAKVCDWLSGQGFEITRREKTRMAVFARGKVSQIATALQTTFARVTSEGVEYTSAITAPQVPSTLAPLLVGINGLQPFILLHTPPVPKPKNLNSAASGSGPVLYMPAQIATAYMASGLYTSTPAVTGSGQTIAILMDDEPLTTDLTSFWSACGISQSLSNITFIPVVSGTLNSSDQTEATLDTEWSSGLAPGAKVRLYTFPSLSDTDIDAALQQVYTDTQNYPIHQLSMSFGAGEAYQTESDVSTEDQSIALLATAGVTLFASAGDGGSTPSSSGTESGRKLNVEWPASNPNVTGVGGTSLVLNSDNSVDTEVVWNKNVVDGYTSDGGTGGGYSTFYSRPSWQTGTGVPSGNMRCVPDVAAPADPAAGAYIWLNGAATSIGGTSWSSPSWAGFCALINQYRANAGYSAIGLLGPNIYPLIGTASFRDITSGNNATTHSGSTNGVSNYTAGTGYDLCTGIGVPNVQTLAQTLTPSTQQAPAFTDGPPTSTATVGTAYSFTYTASGSPAPTFSVPPGSLPTGLSLSSAGVISGTPTADGVFTGTVTAGNGVSPAATQNFSITVNQAPAITNGPPPSTATVGSSYSFTFTASGYPVPTFSVPPGSLPTGLSLSSAGAISGTPTADGVFTGTVTAGNGIGTAATQNFSITVDQAPTITNGPPPNGTNGTPYSFSYQASGYPAPTFSVTPDSLPTGLSLSTAGAISGTPTADGTFTGTVSASNGSGAAATQNFSITITNAPSTADTPTMPPWGLAMLAALLILAAIKRSNRILPQ